MVASVLGWQVRRLHKKNQFKVVAVAGSIGKTSTKFAIANILNQKYKVRFQEGNYNDLVSVPLIFFGQNMPSLFNPVAWLIVFIKNEKQLRRPYPYNLVIVEVGTDTPGDIIRYKQYLHADVGVLTAIAPEHMEYFVNLDAVAQEEINITKMVDKLIFNKDFCADKYLQNISIPAISCAMNQPADIRLINVNFSDQTGSFDVEKSGKIILHADHELVAEPQLYSVALAATVAIEMGLSIQEIESGLKNIHPVSGRMQRLAGMNGSTILDDSYNASPEAMKAALNTLYRLNAPQKIAVLGNMNELGSYSQSAHKEIGQFCDPKRLNLVITLGPDSNKYLASEAKEKGCDVKSFNSPYEIGEYLKTIVGKDAVILVKGSQNGVFAEETVKILLADKADEAKLVRQSDYWMDQKKKTFSKAD